VSAPIPRDSEQGPVQTGRALLRRAWSRVTPDREDDGALRFDVLDPDTREVHRHGRQIELTPIEFSLLELFLRNPRKVLTRAFIFTEVWGFDFGRMSNSLTVYIGYLRRKTEAAGEPRLIHTIRGVGYALHEPEPR
jgi:two-component system, OmpR family, response regulator MprA